MSYESHEQSEVRVSLRRGKKINIHEDGRIFKYQFVDGDGILLTIAHIVTRKGTSIRTVSAVGFELAPETPFYTTVDLCKWATAGYCRLGAHKMQFDSSEFEGQAHISPQDSYTEIKLDATFTNPRINTFSLTHHSINMALIVQTTRQELLTNCGG